MSDPSEEPKFGLFELQSEIDELRSEMLAYKFMMKRMRQRMGILERIFMLLFDDQELLIDRVMDRYKNERKPK